MREKPINLSGAAQDVLYALFFRGALEDGDLPSKSGTAELRELGFAETGGIEKHFQKANRFTFLTPEGQLYAVNCFADGRAGAVKVENLCTFQVKLELDASDVQQKIDKIQKQYNSFISSLIEAEPTFQVTYYKKSGGVVIGFLSEETIPAASGFFQANATPEQEGTVLVCRDDVSHVVCEPYRPKNSSAAL
ncbi:hypothetical protein WAS61_004710 [Citrobacter freundii]